MPFKDIVRLLVMALLAIALRAQTTSVTFGALITPPGRTNPEYHTVTLTGVPASAVKNDGRSNLTIDLSQLVGQAANAINAGPDVKRIDATTWQIGASCSPATPCTANVNGIQYTYVMPATVTAPANAQLRFYISDGSDTVQPGTLVVATHDAVTCDAQCYVATAFAQFAGIPLAIYNGLTVPTVFTDLRTALSIH